jgi:Arc/MetJ-type ribon-helix-helix transcriptional regulator
MLWMIRTQIQLTEEQAAKLKRLAAARDVSMAEVIREAVDRLPDRDDRADRWARALSAIRHGHRDREGKTDVSIRHDEYLAEAIESHLRAQRRTR